MSRLVKLKEGRKGREEGGEYEGEGEESCRNREKRRNAGLLCNHHSTVGMSYDRFNGSMHLISAYKKLKLRA